MLYGLYGQLKLCSKKEWWSIPLVFVRSLPSIEGTSTPEYRDQVGLHFTPTRPRWPGLIHPKYDGPWDPIRPKARLATT